jgi:hypothetical protein
VIIDLTTEPPFIQDPVSVKDISSVSSVAEPKSDVLETSLELQEENPSSSDPQVDSNMDLQRWNAWEFWEDPP